MHCPVEAAHVRPRRVAHAPPGAADMETPATVILRHVIAELLGGPRTRDNGGAVDPPL
jgi:hypothetical protein